MFKHQTSFKYIFKSFKHLVTDSSCHCRILDGVAKPPPRKGTKVTLTRCWDPKLKKNGMPLSNEAVGSVGLSRRCLLCLALSFMDTCPFKPVTTERASLMYQKHHHTPHHNGDGSKKERYLNPRSYCKKDNATNTLVKEAYTFTFWPTSSYYK